MAQMYMQLLIIRLIRVLSAQKRLSILTTTAIKVSSQRFSKCTLCLVRLAEPLHLAQAPLIGLHMATQ